MGRKGGIIFALFCTLWLSHCLTILADDPDSRAAPALQQGSCQLPRFEPEFINFYLEDWPAARKIIDSELRNPQLALVSTGTESRRLRIIMEAFPVGKNHAEYLEGEPYQYAGRRLSQTAFRWTFGIIPIYESRERKLTFEIWEGDSLRQSYDYTTHYYVLVGLPVLFLAPFFDAPDIRADALEKTHRFMVDACNNSSYAFGVN